MAEGRVGPDDLPRLGSRVGRYRVDGLLGRGGMGIVFQATDLELQRQVAIKFLSPELAEDVEFRERFVRESRLAAAIEHPAIVPIYEAGTIGSSLFIAMRFIRGQDLGRLLRAESPLDVQRTLRLVTPLADALDAAHRRGLIHRDVKPANVLVELDGVERPYLTDFGLSRRLGDTTLATRSGPLGTIDYVAPEQIGGGTVDGRADQYALACLIVHCLTGAPPFTGETEAAILFAHLQAPPPRLGEAAPALRGTIEDAVSRALSKDPETRFPDCRAFVAALIAESPAAPVRLPSGTGDAGQRRGASRRPLRGARHRSLMLTGAVLGIGIIVLLAVAPGLTGPPGLAPSTDPSAASPDAPAGGAADEDASDRRRRPSALDLQEREIIVFASDRDGDYDLYALRGGEARPRRLTDTTRDERSPAISPDGRTIAYTVGTTNHDIWLMDLDGGLPPRRLTSGPADDIDPAWSADGTRLAFASDRSDDMYDIWEVRTRAGRLDLATARNLTARPALEHYPTWRPSGDALLISSNLRGGNRDIWQIDPASRGALRQLTSGLAFDFKPDVSPNGRSVAFYRRAYCAACPDERGQSDLVVMDEDSSSLRRVSRTAARDESDPAWSPDGRAIVFVSGPVEPEAGSSAPSELMVTSPDGSQTRRLTDGWSEVVEPSWGRLPAETGPDAAARGTPTASPS